MPKKGKRMGTFHVDCRVEHIADPRKSARVNNLLVDTGSDSTWLPARVLERIGVARVKKDNEFVMANGQTITRSSGYVIIHCDDFQTVDEVVFGEPGDLSLLGARTLEGFNARVDAKQKKLVAAGPMLAAGNHKG